MTSTSPFHVGEQRVQEKLGIRDIERWARKVVRPFMPDEHRDFHTQLPFLVAGARDDAGRSWATLLFGAEGFVTSPDAETLRLDAKLATGDALEGALVPGADLGLLGIELATRRRNRVNGRIGDDASVLLFQVDQSFGNCPQYIHERDWRRVDDEVPGPPARGRKLMDAQRRLIEEADTFFIASGYRGEGDSATFGMDASHRGGNPGFVRVESETRLVFPDYAGNNHYNTIGNLTLDPRVGLLFVDFESGGLLQLTGRAEIEWEGRAVERFPGARRLVHVDIEEIVDLPGALPLRFSDAGSGVRSLRVVEKVKESEEITSFVFESRDHSPLDLFEAGQHLPLELGVPSQADPVRRTYSLSGAPDTVRYRISVKRELKGLVSRHLHDEVEVGAILAARAPAGDFVVGCTNCPVALVSAGVGLTPMLSMLHALTQQESDRPIWWIHGARDRAHHVLANEVARLVDGNANVRSRVAYSRPGPDDAVGVDYDFEGHVTAELIDGFVDAPDAHYYLCGPIRFMADVQEGLEARGVAPERIHSETFGTMG